MKLKLSLPVPEAWDSYVGYVEEFRARGEELIPFVLGFTTECFAAYDAVMQDCEHGVNIPEDFVPHTTHWLLRDGTHVVAVSNLRHYLNDRLLDHGGSIGLSVRPSERRKGYAKRVMRETLVKAKERGLERVMLNCVKTNVGSAQAIMACGGVFEKERYFEKYNDILQYYWIEID